ncbi:MAG: type II toxin-antitoxin system Phd/YefM family antitoxin [Spirochaetales bacterium]|nr:type II toxin-antitoxin system Phd/YefM family antitoxin [Spirochaetales bacterium]
MKLVNIHEAKTRLSSILHEIEKGETFLICRHGIPIAELIPHKKADRLTYHPVLRKISVNYDPTEDLTQEEWGETE